ncbi:major capsid protein [Streptomyces chilikensis]|uniref:Major capsid protein n=1 Tax=Streptomyces chilikensis TaxID=1194079 RepID=A0ABV3EJD9_9ACTN
MADFDVPEDITALDDQQLSDLHDQAVAAFDAQANSTTISPDDMVALRSLTETITAIRGEQQARVEAAQQAAAEIDALAAQVRGGTTEQEPPAVEPVEVEAAAVEQEPAPVEPAPAPVVETPAVTASLARRPALDLSAVRRRQPRVLPEPEPSTIITAAVDVPGFSPGSTIDFDQVTQGVIARANALKTAGGGTGQVISYRHPFQREHIVTDSSSAPEGTTVALAASAQSRLPQGDLVASGGWCAPSETLYQLVDIACPDMLWDLPEIQMARGGLRYFKTPSLDISAMTFVHTEADDIAGSEKPCFQVPCPDPIEVRCTAHGVCLTAGILTQRHFPELVSWYVRNAMVAHEIRVRQALWEEAVATAQAVTLPVSFGALSAVYSAVALQVADMVERHSLCERISLEVVFPWWLRGLFLADIARQNGVSVNDVRPSAIQSLFTDLGVRVQFARGLTPAVPTDIGGATAATTWPAEVSFLIYPAGSLLLGRGEEINLGVIHDSNRFKTNDFTSAFSEECVALVDRSVDTRYVTLPVCASGATGGQVLPTCPTA